VLVAGLAAGRGSADAPSAEAAFACTGCGRCAEVCQLGVDPAAILFRHRADAVTAAAAPAAAAEIARRFHEHGNVHGADLAGQLSRIAARAPVGPASGRVALFAGCTAVAKWPDEVRSAFAVAQALGAPLAPEPAAGLCCGKPLWDAGHRDAFRAHARRFAAEVRGRRRVYALDAGCAHTLATLYPEVGVRFRPEVLPFVDLLAERIGSVRGRPPLAEAVVWHDSGELARTLGRVEEPRRILRAAVAEPKEAPRHGRDAGCSGADGLLPETMPAVAARIAADRAAELAATAPKAVTACPAAALQLRAAGLPIEGLASLLARWLAV
jgi:Fe-S oxidoreductase